MLDGGVCWSSGKLNGSACVQSKLLADYQHAFCGRAYRVQGLHYPQQVHGVHLTADNDNTAPNCANAERVVADAVFTQQRGVKIAVRTADCVPLLAVANDFAMAVHAGWRGLFAGILVNCVKQLATYNLQARLAKWVIGPAISGCNYEVGDELVELFFAAELALTREQACTCLLRGKRKWHLDLQLACVYALLNLGINAKNIEVLRICTYDSHDQFYSYRFAGASAGSNWSYVCL